ncbi:MAG: MaoC family dehydratase N-terminal domain-containing protein [Xanthobacteraceae bacterium]
MNETASIGNWTGRTQQDEDEVCLGAVRRFAAMLDQDLAGYRHGSPLPESWYAILFGPVARQSTLGPDGHPTTGDFLPPLHNTRRMFGGRRVRFDHPLHVGDVVKRASAVRRVEEKTGRSGPFTLVTVVHELGVASKPAIREEQDIVYRPAANDLPATPTARKVNEARDPGEKPDWTRTVRPDPVLLFRYSALTFNAHRIHYDLPYTREREGYPDLVMNGGLTLLLLIETARPHLPGAIAGYTARALRPLFVDQDISMQGRLRDNGAELWACGPNGHRAYEVNVSVGQ